MARIINTPTTSKAKSPTCNAFRTICATASITGRQMRALKNASATGWKRLGNYAHRANPEIQLNPGVGYVRLIETAPDVLSECSDPSQQRFPPGAPSPRPSRESHLPASRSPALSTESLAPQPPPQTPAAGKCSRCRSSPAPRAEEHPYELQSPCNLVCPLLLAKH